MLRTVLYGNRTVMTGGIQWNLRNSTKISATTGPKEGGGRNRRRRPRLGSLVAPDGPATGRLSSVGSPAWPAAPGIGSDGQDQTQKREGESDQVLSVHNRIVRRPAILSAYFRCLFAMMARFPALDTCARNHF